MNGAKAPLADKVSGSFPSVMGEEGRSVSTKCPRPTSSNRAIGIVVYSCDGYVLAVGTIYDSGGKCSGYKAR